MNLQSIRDNAKETLEQSKNTLVVNDDAIVDRLLPLLCTLKSKDTHISAFVRQELSEDKELSLNIFFNVVNFCFKDPYSGSEYVYQSKNGSQIKRSTGLFIAMAESNIDWSDYEALANLSQKKWVDVIQLTNNNLLYLGVERSKRINTFAKYLLDSGNTTIKTLLDNSNYNVDSLIKIIVDSNLFNDDFLKRAQVAIHGVNNVLVRRELTPLEGMEKLTCMADYRIPQVFYNLEIISLNSELLKKIVSEARIDSNSKEELALRSSVIVVGNKLSKIMNIPESEVDLLLWNLSQKMAQRNELKIPHMIVATDKY